MATLIELKQNRWARYRISTWPSSRFIYTDCAGFYRKKDGDFNYPFNPTSEELFSNKWENHISEEDGAINESVLKINKIVKMSYHLGSDTVDESHERVKKINIAFDAFISEIAELFPKLDMGKIKT